MVQILGWLRAEAERETYMYKNHIDLIGFLGSDPEARSTSNGTAVTTFSLATKSSWKNEAGSFESRTEWHRIVAWDSIFKLRIGFTTTSLKKPVNEVCRPRLTVSADIMGPMLNEAFSAKLQKSPNHGGWTYVVWPDSVNYRRGPK